MVHSNLTNYLRRYITISDTENERFQSCLKEVSLKKKELLLREGQVCRNRYFILKGCLKMFYIDSKGNEQIIHFGIDNWWITEYESLINQVPSKINIQAVEDTELLALSLDNFKSITTEIPEINTLFRLIMEKTFVAAQRRLEYMLSYSGEELFQQFTTNNASFCQSVPQYLIASYLGMTPEFYSKIRKKVS